MIEFVPRVALTAAEAHVDFAAHNTHIVERRDRVEKAAAPTARRLAVLAVSMYVAPQAIVERLEQKLEQALNQTARFGYREARREIDALRSTSRPPARARVIHDFGLHGRLARGGLSEVSRLTRRRSREVAMAVATSAINAARGPREAQQAHADLLTAAQLATSKTLHNSVLELVGETLNLGRTAGALSVSNPPEFAMRSEQLDRNTCDGCDEEHGGVYQVDSDDYYAHLPPAGCYGGGRCRGVMVFGDGPADVRLPESQAA